MTGRDYVVTGGNNAVTGGDYVVTGGNNAVTEGDTAVTGSGLHSDKEWITQ